MLYPSSAAADWAIEHCKQLLADRSVTVLTGAGISTDSGIPDYRGGGKSPRNPITFQQFTSSPEVRARYWARSFFGWNRISQAAPNTGHLILAKAESAGKVREVITQNVDGLHSKAGQQRLVELHGRLAEVVCLGCGDLSSRDQLTERLAELNPRAEFNAQVEIAPDGDADVIGLADFQVPNCRNCDGILKPRVVFFGETIPAEVTREARRRVSEAEALLVVGSSLAVNSALRLVQLATQSQVPVAIVNAGETKADQTCDVKLVSPASSTLEALFGH